MISKIVSVGGSKKVIGTLQAQTSKTQGSNLRVLNFEFFTEVFLNAVPEVRYIVLSVRAYTRGYSHTECLMCPYKCVPFEYPYKRVSECPYKCVPYVFYIFVPVEYS